MLQRLCRRPPNWFGAVDNMALVDVAEEFRELVDDLTETQPRAKLLQEELAARLAGANQQQSLHPVGLYRHTAATQSDRRYLRHECRWGTGSAGWERNDVLVGDAGYGGDLAARATDPFPEAILR